MMSVVETLERARNLIADPARWTQGAYAKERTSDDDEVDVLSRRAHAFCGLGAVRRVLKVRWGAPCFAFVEATELLDTATHEHTDGAFDEFSEFQDQHDTSHESVLAVFQRAIELGKG